MNRKILFLFLPIIFLLGFSSCRTNRYVYVQEKSVLFDEDEKDSLYITQPTDYLLQPDDNLYIKIFSHEEIVEKELSSQVDAAGNNMQGSERMDYLNGYEISETGHVDIPLIGKIFVQGKTVKEAEIALQKKVDDFLINSKVVLKLLNFRITFLGEVGTEGVRFFYQRNLNLLEAIAAVGGINDNGKRHNVLILRKHKNGRKSIRIDLTDRSIITDPKFYLKPNDIIYVEPDKSKQFRLRLADYALVIGTITSTISTLLLVITLSN